MVQKSDEFKVALRTLLRLEEGISVECEATVYIRSLEGGAVVAGVLDDSGRISSEKEFSKDIDVGIDYFISQCESRNLGSTRE